jgi:hypothetical protein
VLLDAGRVDEARAALARGSKFIQANGSPILKGLHHIVAAKLALRADRDAASATAILEQINRDAASGYSLVGELAQTWRGLAALIENDEDCALSSLRAAVAGMRAGHRILELPTAAVYLAEAEWRAGNQDAADQAADIARAWRNAMSCWGFSPPGKVRRPAVTNCSTPCSTPAPTSPRTPTCAKRSSACADCCPPTR